MTELNRKAWAGLLQLVAILAAILFLPAWTLDYWQAWAFIAVFSACALAITVYLMKHDPQLLERRLKGGPGAETLGNQKIIMLLASCGFTSLVLVPALDHRFAWSAVPPWISLAADVLIALGYLAIYFVFKENSYAASAIKVGEGQSVISTGPYSRIRHPMYLGGVVMLLAMPPALGSWWGLLVMLPLAPVLIWRLLDEERFLAKNLPGYTQYQAKVKYRLVPYVW